MVDHLDGQLVATKLQPPTIPTGLVRRSRLRTRLDAALDAHHRFVLVSAPAGSGKSTMLAGWLAERSESIAWLQVEASDSDPARFWAYLAAAIARPVPSVDAATAPALAAVAVDETALITALVNELAAHAEPVLIVIDDYHLIANPAVHRGLERLIELCPDQTAVIIATRIDPPFRLGRLRVRNQMSEIRVADLRFEPDEASELLAERGLDDALLGRLCDRTEGWAAGLVLAGISLETAGDVESFVDSFRGDDQLVVEYLSDELLASLGADDRRRMLETSILERFDGELIDAVTGMDDGADWLRRTAATNQLLIGLDRTGTWYRYHHLLRDLLRLQLERASAERVADLHLAAGRWHREHGDLHDAVEHTLAGGDLATAADLISDNATKLLNGGQVVTVVGQLDRLGDVADGHSGCCIVRGWISFTTGQSAAAQHWFEEARRLDVDGVDAGLIASLGLMIRLSEGDVAGALELVDEVPQPSDSTQAYAHAAVYTWAGKLDEARRYVSLAVERAAAEPSNFVAAAISSFEAVIEIESGSPAAAAINAARGIEFAADHGLADASQLAGAHGIVARTSDDPAVLAASALRGVELARRVPDRLMLGYALASAGDALCSIDHPDGRAMLTEARSVVARSTDPGIVGQYLARVESRHGAAAPQTDTGGLVEALTDREIAVLRFLPTQLSQREIASELFVSMNTVKSHCKAIYRKLGVGDRHTAVQAARDLDLV